MYALSLISGAAATVLSGVLTQFFVLPSTTVADTQWSYPWPSDTFVLVCLVYAVFHALVLVGVLGFARGDAVGTSRAARAGGALAVAGTGVLLVAELASIPFRDEALSATGPSVVGAVFGLGTLLTAVGFLMLGVTTLRAGVWQGWRRYVPLATGVWTTLLVGLAATPLLPFGVGVYGLCLLLLGVAMRSPVVATTARIAV
ncbi:hypothetical protein UK23_26395 [Lentzea aerocolonigenes]|uniref:DUF4386 family protein n=1 Tax=Lentzea aerocolonigenes TaxID=68170 RepID=A0A0F0GTK0_LENAE|nr:hypothetical protein [Lentzea aerocolonigenes]KJK45352.1 hypothetical protein UK23_26395 [Lentzea aerocolonigenes]